MRKSLNASGTVSFGLPSAVTLVLGLLAGVAQAFQWEVLNVSTGWHTAAAAVLAFVAVYQISPLVGSAFVTALHLPPWALGLIGAVLASVTAVLGLTHGMSLDLRAWLTTIVTVLGTLGFGANQARPAGQ